MSIAINGKVLNIDFNPLSNVKVYIYNEKMQQVWSGTTNSNGLYSSGTINIKFLTLNFTVKKGNKKHSGPLVFNPLDLISGVLTFAPIVWAYTVPSTAINIPVSGKIFDYSRQAITGMTIKLFHLIDTNNHLIADNTDSNGNFSGNIKIEDLRPSFFFRVTKGSFTWQGLFVVGINIYVPYNYNPLIPGLWKISDPGPNSYSTSSLQRDNVIAFSNNGMKPINIFNFSSENIDGGHFNGPGKRYSFRLHHNKIEYKKANMGEKFKGVWQPFQTDIDNGMTSYHTTCDGEDFPTPEFDLFSAKGNRLFAKEKNTDRFFITTIDHLFWNYNIAKPDYKPISAAIFFKLDPEQGIIPRSLNKRSGQINITSHYGLHPATWRFDIYKKLLSSSPVSMIANMMIVNQRPKHWYHIDSRTPVEKFDPVDYPIYPNITYEFSEVIGATATNLLFPKITKFAVDFTKVMSLGIGSCHWHEQYSTIYGGEIQPIFDKELLGPVKYSDFYKSFNGPVYDGDGFVDGTVTYYMLCELNQKNSSKQKYAILYIDEQFYFSSRWRVVGIEDINPDDLMDFCIAKTINVDSSYDFDENYFFDPFKGNYINEHSRLSVARQVIVVNGQSHGSDVLFSINFSFSTIDRSWRLRGLPSINIDYTLGVPTLHTRMDKDLIVNATHDDSVNPQSIILGDDMTIVLEGTKSFIINGRKYTYKGRYFQKYLPSSLEYPKSHPGRFFTHGWQFVKESAYQSMEKFSHFGVYEKVDDRHQYYELDIEQNDLIKLADDILWRDKKEFLQIEYSKYEWSVSLGPVSSVVAFQKPLSLYNSGAYFKVYDKGLKIAVFADKRDDDLIFASNFEKKVILENTEDETITITPKFLKHHYVDAPPQVKEVKFITIRNGPSKEISYLSIQFTMPENVFRRRTKENIEQNIDESVYNIKVGIPNDISSTEKNNIILEINRDEFIPKGNNRYIFVKKDLTSEEIKLYDRYCTSSNYWKEGTSIWFEDIVGQKNIAENTEFKDLTIMLPHHGVPLPPIHPVPLSPIN